MGLCLILDKFHFAENEVVFARFLISADGVKPIKKMTEAILHFPMATNIMGNRFWFELRNQICYVFSQAEVIGTKHLTNFFRSQSE